MTEVVLTYRCGAVPESHRVPCCLAAPWRGEPVAFRSLLTLAGALGIWSICGHLGSQHLFEGCSEHHAADALTITQLVIAGVVVGGAEAFFSPRGHAGDENRCAG